MAVEWMKRHPLTTAGRRDLPGPEQRHRPVDEAGAWPPMSATVAPVSPPRWTSPCRHASCGTPTGPCSLTSRTIPAPCRPPRRSTSRGWSGVCGGCCRNCLDLDVFAPLPSSSRATLTCASTTSCRTPGRPVRPVPGLPRRLAERLEPGRGRADHRPRRGPARSREPVLAAGAVAGADRGCRRRRRRLQPRHGPSALSRRGACIWIATPRPPRAATPGDGVRHLVAAPAGARGAGGHAAAARSSCACTIPASTTGPTSSSTRTCWSGTQDAATQGGHAHPARRARRWRRRRRPAPARPAAARRLGQAGPRLYAAALRVRRQPAVPGPFAAEALPSTCSSRRRQPRRTAPAQSDCRTTSSSCARRTRPAPWPAVDTRRTIRSSSTSPTARSGRSRSCTTSCSPRSAADPRAAPARHHRHGAGHRRLRAAYPGRLWPV